MGLEAARAMPWFPLAPRGPSPAGRGAAGWMPGLCVGALRLALLVAALRTAREEANTALSRAVGSIGRMKIPEVVWGERRGGHREAAQAIP